MDWQYHVKHLFIYCMVHINRGIEKAAGQRRTAFHKIMESLLLVKSKKEYLEVIQHLQRKILLIYSHYIINVFR